MMDEEALVKIYEQISVITDDMLNAAKNKELQRLEQLELTCRELIANLPSSDSRTRLSKDALSKKILSIKKMLKNDKEIRNILEPWMTRFSRFIHPNKPSESQEK